MSIGETSGVNNSFEEKLTFSLVTNMQLKY